MAGQAGYATFFLKGASGGQTYFDNFSVTSTSPLQELHHYYPYGREIGDLKYVNPDADPYGMRHNALPYGFASKRKMDWANLPFQDFGARMYDSQLGRWNAVDPLAVKFSNFTPYGYCNDAPIQNIDPNGMDWESAIDRTLAQLLQDKLRGDAKRQDNKASRNERRADKALSKGNLASAEKFKSRASEARQNASNLRQSASELQEMGETTQMSFTFHEVETGEKPVLGVTTGKDQRKVVHINYISIDRGNGTTRPVYGNQVHEAHHAYQYLKGQITLISGDAYSSNMNMNVNHEIESYQRQYSADPTSMQIDPGSLNGITPQYIWQLKDPKGKPLYPKEDYPEMK